jgi:hypothetical protein
MGWWWGKLELGHFGSLAGKREQARGYTIILNACPFGATATRGVRESRAGLVLGVGGEGLRGGGTAAGLELDVVGGV